MRRSTVYAKEGKHCIVATHQEMEYPMTCEFQLLISVVVTVCLREEMKFSLSVSQAGSLEAKVYLVFFLDNVTYFMT
jgi:hypothetical protein